MSEAETLLQPWSGPFGGLPPFDSVTPEGIEQASLEAIAHKRAEVEAICKNTEPATFANTVEALEDCGRSLNRLNALRGAFASTKALGDTPNVQQRIVQAVERLEDDIAHDDALFARLQAVAALPDLTAEHRRLTEVILDRLRRRGAGLAPARCSRLAETNAALASLQTQFSQNLVEEEKATAVFFESAEALEGLPQKVIDAAAQAAAARGRAGAWAISNTRPSVWQVLTHCQMRETRKRIQEQWAMGGQRCGEHDNRPVIAQIMKLRGEKAQLLGYPSFAHWACAARAAKTPEAVMDQLTRTWRPVLKKTRAQLAELQVLADADGLGEALESWDRLYYSERLRQSRFGLDGNAVKPYLTLDNVLAAVFDAARTQHYLTARELRDVPVIHPDVRVFAVDLRGRDIGLVYFDLMHREGKMRGSWQSEYRPYENFHGESVVLSGVVSNLERPAEGPVLLTWEYANVLFHEFGHALHMLMGRARYPSLGSMAVAWDMIEAPSLLNEHWLYDSTLLRKHMRHFETGEPIPDTLIDGIEAATKYDRVFSVGLEYLSSAIVDMRAHMAADGSDIDVLAIERDAHVEFEMPPAVQPVMHPPQAFHLFAGEAYAAGLYSYLWADVMVADILEAFHQAPGGLHDDKMAQRWRESFLSVGNGVSGDAAFRALRGRNPDPMALLRRFDLAT